MGGKTEKANMETKKMRRKAENTEQKIIGKNTRRRERNRLHERRRRKKDNAERRQNNGKGREREIRYKRYQDIVNADSTKKVKKMQIIRHGNR